MGPDDQNHCKPNSCLFLCQMVEEFQTHCHSFSCFYRFRGSLLESGLSISALVVPPSVHLAAAIAKNPVNREYGEEASQCVPSGISRNIPNPVTPAAVLPNLLVAVLRVCKNAKMPRAVKVMVPEMRQASQSGNVASFESEVPLTKGKFDISIDLRLHLTAIDSAKSGEVVFGWFVLSAIRRTAKRHRRL